MAGIGASVVIGAEVGLEAEDWPDAIRKAARPLVERGAVEPRYVQRSIELVEEQGPYMVLAPGIALAHARPEDGALRLGLCVARLAHPVSFGHLDNDPVDLVFAFASPDNKQHVGLLSALAHHLLAGLAEKIRAAKGEAEVSELLTGVLADVR